MTVGYLGSPEQEDWQQKFDGWFPDGAVASWMEPPAEWHPVIYSVPWVEVVAVDEADPVLLMRPYGTDRVVGPYRMTAHEVLRTRPHLLFAATLTGDDRRMLLSAGMEDRLRVQMKPERAEQQAHPYPSYAYPTGA